MNSASGPTTPSSRPSRANLTTASRLSTCAGRSRVMAFPGAATAPRRRSSASVRMPCSPTRSRRISLHGFSEVWANKTLQQAPPFCVACLITLRLQKPDEKRAERKWEKERAGVSLREPRLFHRSRKFGQYLRHGYVGFITNSSALVLQYGCEEQPCGGQIYPIPQE